MTQQFLSRGVTQSLRAGLVRRHLRRAAVYTAALPLVVSAMSGCGDTINNEYINNYPNPQGGENTATPSGGQGGDPHNDGGVPNVTEGGAGASTGGAGGDPQIDAGGAGGVVTAGGAGGAGGVDESHVLYPDAPYADTPVAEQELDIFGTIGTKFWFGVSETQLALMNERDQGGNNGDIYTPGGGGDGTYVDHLWVSAPGENGQTADYGKVKVKIVGQSTARPWTKTSIPNLNIDSNDFVKGQLIDGYEHLRLNNAQVGSIFREWLSLTMYSKLNYPAPHVSFAWAGSNVWGPGVEVPMVLVERYKRKFCTRFPEFGGKCNNMWEFYGDFAQGGGFPFPKGGGGIGPSIFDQDICQFDQCENTRAKELETLVSETPQGDGFKAALADYIDWPAFHRFQCLSWVLATGDDALHNNNNVVLAEGADGKFRYLPYSTDISFGQDWYREVALPGTNSISRGCQAETSCWADTIAACEDVVAEFQGLDPVKVLDDLHDMLDQEGMLRSGDEGRYASLRSWFQGRLVALPVELEQYRDNPNQTFCNQPYVDCGGYCDFPQNCGMNCGINPEACGIPCGKPQVDCGGYCDLPENCGQACVPPVGVLAGDLGAGGAADGAAGAGPGPICPKIMNYAIEP